MATNIPGMSVSAPREITSAFPEVGAAPAKEKMADLKGSGFSKGGESPMFKPDDYKMPEGKSEGAGVPDMGSSSGATFGGDARDTANYG